MEMAPEHGLRRLLARLVFVVLLVYVTSPVVTNWDSYLGVPTAYSLLAQGDLDLDEYQLAPIVDHYGYYEQGGRHYDFYGWPTAVFHLPAVAAVEAAHAVGVGPGVATLIEEDRMAAIQLLTASVIAALIIMLVAVAAFEQFPAGEHRRRRLAIGIALGTAFATPMWSTASRALWQHGPSMLALAVAIIYGGRLASGVGDEQWRGRAAAIVGAAVAASYAVRPSNVVAVVAFCGWIVFTQRQRLPRFALGAAGVAIPFFVANLVGYGGLLPPSHLTGGRLGHGHYPEALMVNLVSPGRGLLVFTPLALLAVAGVIVRRRQDTLGSFDLTLVCICIGHWLLVSATAGWWGGHGFGPRYMADLVPLLAYLAVPAVGLLARPQVGGRRLVVVAVAAGLGWGVFVHAQGAYLRSSACWNTEPVDVNIDTSRVWDWTDPQFLRGARRLARGPVREAALGACPSPLGGINPAQDTFENSQR